MTISQLQQRKQTPKKNETPVGEIEVKPHEESHMSLGVFRLADAPIGFSIYISPDTSTADLIQAEIVTSETGRSREFALHIANNGDKAICAEICQLVQGKKLPQSF